MELQRAILHSRLMQRLRGLILQFQLLHQPVLRQTGQQSGAPFTTALSSWVVPPGLDLIMLPRAIRPQRFHIVVHHPRRVFSSHAPTRE